MTSSPRTFTAAELAADSETAREVWAAWGRKEVDIVTAFLGEPILGVKTAKNGDVTLRTGTGWRLEAGVVKLHVRPRVPAPPTYDELQAALRFYADAATYRASNGVMDAFSGRGTSPIEEDSGARARAALKGGSDGR